MLNLSLILKREKFCVILSKINLVKFVSQGSEIKIDFKEVEKLHRNGASAFETTRLLTFLLDKKLRAIAESLNFNTPFAIVALGGYGRVELCPKSDIDIMFLVENKSNGVENVVVEFFQKLWDESINIGHSFRTIKDCLELFEFDFESWASILEARFVYGDTELYNRFIQQVRSKALSRDSEKFISGIIEGNRIRHEKYGNSIKLLEPNVKKSAGGLRDIHTLLWLFKSTNPDFWNLPSDKSACKSMLELMHAKKIISDEQFNLTLKAFEFILRTRIELHFDTEGTTDVLDFNVQEKISRGLGYKDEGGVKAVEIFMRDYYLNARAIYSLNKFFVSKFKEKFEPQDFGEIEVIDSNFSIRNGRKIFLNFGKKFLTPVEIFTAFLHRCKFGVDFDEELKDAIMKSSERFNFENEDEVNKIFLKILNSHYNVASTLELMNELGILGKYIPEFGNLTGLFQHSVYHFYTVDEHTLKAIGNAENLTDDDSNLGDIFRNLQRRDILYLAILFHDSGKAIKVEGHSKIGAEMARNFLQKIKFDAIDDVCFLVENHLLMEQTAFRRNFYEPETLFNFASKFYKSDLLDMLYILTYADLSAVNPEVWTSWKAQLLEELYFVSKPIVENKLTLDEVYRLVEERTNKRIESIIASLSDKISREIVENHFENLIEDDSYLSVFSDVEIEEHIKKIVETSEKKVDVVFKKMEGYTEITVITKDAPFVLASICGVLSANDANIFDAKIFTRKDGIVIDKFRVFDYISGLELSQTQCKKIEKDLNDVFNGLVDLDEIFEKHRRKWKRRIESTKKDVKIAVEFEDSKDYTIIDVFAPDSLGFLYKVSRKISELGLNIYFAKIATRTDGIVDSFYVLDLSGRKICDEKFKEKIKEEILNVIYELNNLKLTAE